MLPARASAGGHWPLTDLPPFDDADLFDEAGYLRLYPGIAEAMMHGIVATAWDHFSRHGRNEGRQPNDVDPTFYLASYPEIERDLGHPPSPSDAAAHYITLGRTRGYRPNARAPRATNGAAMPSPFGGFWTDHANALDLIQCRLDPGLIRRKDAAMLRTFALDGIVELIEAHDRDQLRDAALIVDQAFTGMFPNLLFGAEARGIAPQPWRPELTEQPVAALDPHMVSRKVREMLLDKMVTNFLALLFNAQPRLAASRAFLREAAAPDRDAAWNAYTLPLQFVAVSFALEATEAGAALVWPGSQRLPDLPWPGGHLSVSEAWRAKAAGLEAALVGREERVRGLVHGQEPRQLPARLGTRMIRHANLIHAAEPPFRPLQRRTLTAWFCPSFVAPEYMETAPTRVHMQDGVAFSSGVYPAMDPVD
jgi:hypothetical protein